jgi:hypothetical protein
MIAAQQLGTISPGQLTLVQPGQLTTAPGVGVAQTEIGDLLTSIMPLIMMMMVFMMITPMMKGLGEGFK